MPESLEKHLELSQNHDHQQHVYPIKNDKYVFFKQYKKMHRIPFVVYADFECLVEPIDNKIGNGTVQYQKHTPSGFCYTIKCMEESVYKGKTVLYTAKEDGEDIGKKFVNCLESDLKEVYEILKTIVPINMSGQEEESFKNAVVGYACGLELGNDRVRDHCHLTSKYRGAAHDKCNFKMKTPKIRTRAISKFRRIRFPPFCKKSLRKISCIPKTDEKFISFSKQIVMETITNEKGKEIELKLEIRFLDLMKFTLKSLDGLAKVLGPNLFKSLKKEMGDNKLLKKKGVFPYEFMTDFDKLNVSELPPKEKFYNKLNDSNISDEEHKHAQKVWNEFNCKTMRDYHNLYLKTDVLLLANVIENYRDVCINNYSLDPLLYYTAPGLVWDAALNISKITLELITDPDMYLMIENGIQGGISTVMKRYAKANNPYIGKIRDKTPIKIMKELKQRTNEERQFSVEVVCEFFPDFSAEEIIDLKRKMENREIFNPKETTTYIMYLNANNLYGWAMSHLSQLMDLNG